jgi:hypothetical protein
VPCAGAEEALAAALDSPEGLLVVTGSLYLVGEARQILRERFGVPPPAALVPAWEDPMGAGARTPVDA